MNTTSLVNYNTCCQPSSAFQTQLIENGLLILLRQDADQQLPLTPFLGQQVKSDVFSFTILNSGTVKSTINLKPMTLIANDLMVLTPDSICQVDYISDDCEFESLCFSEEYLLEAISTLNEGVEDFLLYLFSQSEPKWSLSPKWGDFFRTILSDLKQTTERNERLSLRLQKDISRQAFILFFLQFAEISWPIQSPQIERFSRKEQLMLAFYRLVRAHFRTERSVAFYASKLFITPKYLGEVVKNVTNKTASEIIDHFVVQEAKLNLSNPSITVAQVADSLHFADQSAFGKYFKRILGISPLFFRKKLVNGHLAGDRTGLRE